MQRRNNYKTINTFTRKPCFNQIVSYIVVISQNLSFWLLIQSNYANLTSKYTMIISFTLSSLLLVILGFVASKMDPSDPIMINYKNGKSNVLQQCQNGCLFCQYCESYVISTSRHCKICDRCVDQFDHHCIWINNCIGKNNYKIFIAMIITVFMNMVLYMISVALLWLQFNWAYYLPSMIINWIIFAVALIFSLLVLGLITLHFYLIYHNLTTFQYIMRKRNSQVAPNPIKPFTTTHLNEGQQRQEASSNSQDSQSSQADDRVSQNNQVFKTQNELNQVVSAFNQNEHQRQSDFQSIDHIKSTQNKNAYSQKQKLRSQVISKCQEQLQFEDNFNDFYKKNRGLKILVGPAILVRPKRSKSNKEMRRNSINSNMPRLQAQNLQKIIVLSDNNQFESEKHSTNM